MNAPCHLPLLLAPAILALSGVGREDETIWRVRAQSIDAYLGAIEPAFSGVVLLAAGPDVLIAKGYGSAIDALGIPNSGATAFSVDSIAKQFTAAAILRLEDEGRLSTEDTLADHFEDLPDDKLGIRLSHLLGHTSGLLRGNSVRFEDHEREAVLERILHTPVRFAAGTRFEYGNFGYVVLAAIVEQVSGRSFDEFLKSELFAPSEMRSTGIRRMRPGSSVVAHRYDSSNVGSSPLDLPYPDWNIIGAGNVISSARDLLRWHRALSNDSVLSRDSREKLHTPGNNPHGYALGWVVRDSKQGRVAHHNGASSYGSATHLRRYLDRDVVLVLHANRDGEARLFAGGVLDEILRLMWIQHDVEHE